MASGWAKDGAVQDQIDATIEDAVNEARSKMLQGESAEYCFECDAPIPEARRTAIPGVELCVACQSKLETESVASGGINRRGNKDSQIR